MFGWEIAEKLGQAYQSCDAGRQVQDKCLYSNRASDYEACYWEGQKAAADTAMINGFFNVTGVDLK